MRLPVAPLILFSKLEDNDPAPPVLASFRQFYAKRWGVQPSIYAGYIHDAVQLVIAALRRGRSVKPEDVRNMIENSRDLISTSGPVKMSPTDYMGLRIDSFRMAEISGGTWELLE